MQRRSQHLLPFSIIYTIFALLLFLIFNSVHGVPSMTLVTVLDPQHPVTVAPLPSLLSAKRKDESETSGFWLTTDLLQAEFRKGCLSTALCHEPRFRLINTMTVNGEESVISWPANSGGDLVQDHARAFVTHWTEGDPEDVALSCQVAGTDPSFGFARVCDETPSKRVFNEAAIQRTLAGGEQQPVGGGVGDTVTRRLERRGAGSASNRVTRDDDRMIVELRGRCFNATLAVRKHLTRCPWCPDPNVQIAVGDAASAAAATGSDERSGASTLFQRRISAGDLLLVHNLVIVALSGAVVFAFTGLCCAVGFHCHYRRRHRRKGSSATTANPAAGVGGIIIGSGSGGGGKKRLLKFAPSPSEVYKQQQQQQQQQYGANLHESQKYETPWDNAANNNNNKYRPLPHQQWMIDAELLEGADTMPASEASAAHHHHHYQQQQQQQHYQTLTLTRGGGVMAFPSAPPPPPPPLYGVKPPQHGGGQSQVSGSSLAATGSARSSGGSGSTSATTLGSVGSAAGAIITVSPTVNNTSFSTLSRQNSSTQNPCCGAPPALPPNPYFTHHPHSQQQLHLQPLPPPQRNSHGTTASLARRFHNNNNSSSNNNNKTFHDDSGLDSV